ncbi:MAG: amidohydrolase family protein [Pseudomonadota bacterium]
MATTTLLNCIALLGPNAERSPGPVDIVIDGRRIAAIRPAGSQPPTGTAIEARNRLVTAGLINGHLHSHESFYKGRKDNLPLELWMNYVRPLKPIPLTPRQVYLRTMAVAIEALRSGTTTLCDDMNISPVIRPDHVAAVYQAYEDSGIRALVGPTLFDRPFFRAMPFVDEEFPPTLLAELDAGRTTSGAELLAFARGLARDHHPREHRVGFIAAPSAPQRCTEEFLRAVRAMADELDLPVMSHVQETRLQVVTGQLWHGKTMIEYLDTIGFLKPNTTLIHGVWLTPREIDILARSGATVQHNPTSNLKTGSGLMPLRALLDAKVNVSLGSDGCGSIDTCNMQYVLMAAALLHKLRGDHTSWVGAREAFLAGTMGGARAIGFGDALGAVEVGRLADLAVYRLDRVPFAPLNDPLNQLVYAESGSSLDMMFVDGEPVMRDGQLSRIDEAALLAELTEEHAKLAPLLDASERDVERMIPPYERIYRRCQAIDIAPDTYPARF